MKIVAQIYLKMNVVSSSKLFFTEPILDLTFQKKIENFPQLPHVQSFIFGIYLFIYFLISCRAKKTFNIACVAGGILVTRGCRVSREANGEAERSREGKCIHCSRGSAAKTIRLIQQQNGKVSRRRRTQIKQLLDQWLSGKLGTGSRVQSFPRAFPSSNEVPVLLLNQPKHRQHSHSNPVSYSGYFQQNVMNYTVLEKNWYFFYLFFLALFFHDVALRFSQRF